MHGEAVNEGGPPAWREPLRRQVTPTLSWADSYMWLSRIPTGLRGSLFQNCSLCAAWARVAIAEKQSMSKGVQKDTKEEHGANEHPADDQAEPAHSGEGAASAFAQMISRGRQRRHQTGEANDTAGRMQ